MLYGRLLCKTYSSHSLSLKFTYVYNFFEDSKSILHSGFNVLRSDFTFEPIIAATFFLQFSY